MEDIILISSGSEEDSDDETLSIYENGKNSSSSFVKKEWPRRSPLSDLTDSGWASSRRRCRRKCPSPSSTFLASLRECSPLGFAVDLQDPAQSCAVLEGEKRTHKYPKSVAKESRRKYPRQPLADTKSSTTVFFDSITEFCQRFSGKAPEEEETGNHVAGVPWKCPEKSSNCSPSPSTFSLCSSQCLSPFDPHYEEKTIFRLLGAVAPASSVPVEPSVALPSSSSHLGNSMQFFRYSEIEAKVEALDSKIPQLQELMGACSSENGLAEHPDIPSPVGSYSPYYCPSLEDPLEFSDVSSQSPVHEELPDGVCSAYSLAPNLEEAQAEGLTHPTSSCETGALGESDDLLGRLSQLSQEVCPVSPEMDLPKTCQSVPGRLSPAFADALADPSPAPSPTYTDVLAGNSSDWLVDDAELPVDSPPSPLSLCSTPTSLSELCENRPSCGIGGPLPSSMWGDSNEEMVAKTDSDPGVVSREASHQQCHYVSPSHLRRLRNALRRPSQIPVNDSTLLTEFQVCDGGQADEKEKGHQEPLCRYSLSLVNTTIEENYTEGTLQLLSDFLHSCVYPPSQITNHLLRGILLNAHCPLHLVIEAYTLLMRIQKYHPADCSTVPWDWELLTSVMNEQDLSKKHSSSVVRMLLQYILQTMEDDFLLKLKGLSTTITAVMLSCEKKFTCIRDVIGWLVSAVVNSLGDLQEKALDTEEKKMTEQDENLKVVFLLQRMLQLAMEVDRSPTCNSNKISQELFHTLISIVPLRQHRMLLLETLESSLLKCKVLELLLGHSCPCKVAMPMSLKLLLHFLQNSTLTPDPRDGAEKWRSWNELLELLWMLLLSYEEVKEGHLRMSITERVGYDRPPIQTINDQITRMEVLDAAKDFQSQVSADLGSALPPQLRDLFSSLLGYLLDACQF